MNYSELKSSYMRACAILGVNPEEMVLGAGGACVVYEVRLYTQDLDLEVPDWLYDKLISEGHTETIHTNPNIVVLEYTDTIQLHRSSGDGRAVEIDGIWVYPLEKLLEQKLSLNRPKDQTDIQRLQALAETA